MHVKRILKYKVWCCFGHYLAHTATLSLIACLLLSLIPFSMQGVKAQDEQAQDALTLSIQAPATVAAGQVIVLQLVLEGQSEGAIEIGGVEAEILYNHNAAEYAGFSNPPPPEAASLGNMVVPFSPGGSVVAYYRCSTEPCLEARSERVAMAMASTATANGA